MLFSDAAKRILSLDALEALRAAINAAALDHVRHLELLEPIERLIALQEARADLKLEVDGTEVSHYGDSDILYVREGWDSTLIEDAVNANAEQCAHGMTIDTDYKQTVGSGYFPGNAAEMALDEFLTKAAKVGYCTVIFEE